MGSTHILPSFMNIKWHHSIYSTFRISRIFCSRSMKQEQHNISPWISPSGTLLLGNAIKTRVHKTKNQEPRARLMTITPRKYIKDQSPMQQFIVTFISFRYGWLLVLRVGTFDNRGAFYFEVIIIKEIERDMENYTLRYFELTWSNSVYINIFFTIILNTHSY